MRGINAGLKASPPPERFFCTGDCMELKECGLYIIKDVYFVLYNSPTFLLNKNESRPHFYAVKDKDGIIWMVPMSSKVDKYRARIEKEEAKRGLGNCIYYHLGIIAGKERAFNISSMFPITEKYISHPYTINGIPYIVKDETLVRKLRSKVKRYLRLLEQHQLRDTNHVLKIRDSLIEEMNK